MRKWLLFLFCFAFVLRLYFLSWPGFYTGIESLHIPSAVVYTESGHFTPDNDYSAPFRKLLQYPLIKLYGDTPIARRLPGVVFASLTVLFVMLIGQKLWPEKKVGFWAGLLLAVDPLHNSFSRTTWEDIPAAFFLLAGVYFLHLAVQNNRISFNFLLTASLFLSLALATRRYVISMLVAVFFYLSLTKRKLILLYFCLFFILPLTFYLLTFYPWFTRGYSLTEWLSFQNYMIGKEFSGVSPQLSGYAALYGHSYKALDWFIKPVIFGFVLPLNSSLTAVFLALNNPFSWFLIWPSLFFLLFNLRQDKKIAWLIAGFALLYLPFLLARRQVLIYSSLAVLPFAFLLLAAAISFFAEQSAFRRKIGTLLIAFITVTSLLFYPLAIGYPLSPALVSYLPFKGYLQQPSADFLKTVNQ